jgi:hypothetical protein
VTVTAHPSYKLTDVPPAPAGSRFALPRTAAGWPAEPADALALAYNQLAQARTTEAPELPPATKTVDVFRVAIEQGTYVLVSDGQVTGRPTREPVRPGKFARKKLSGGALLDSLFLGEEAYVSYRDNDVWEALLELCEEQRPRGESLRRLNIEVRRLVLLRAGIEMKQ